MFGQQPLVVAAPRRAMRRGLSMLEFVGCFGALTGGVILGSIYLGGTNLVAKQRAGVLAERRPGAIRELWRAFRTDLAPTPAIGF